MSQTIVSSSSFKAGSVSPGELISIYGANLGPNTPVSATGSGNLPTSLGGTTVTFDGTPVPLFYVSSSVVNVETPVTLTPGNTTTIGVTSTFGQSTTVTLPVVPARPGIYTVESGGAGQARAINQDGTTNGNGTVTANGSDKPAPPGSVIQLFASGLGTLNPRLPPVLRLPAARCRWRPLPTDSDGRGTVAADVQYAGAAPTLVGLFQVNVKIPANAPAVLGCHPEFGWQRQPGWRDDRGRQQVSTRRSLQIHGAPPFRRRSGFFSEHHLPPTHSFTVEQPASC